MEEVVKVWRCSYCHKTFCNKEECQRHEESEKATLKFLEAAPIKEIILGLGNGAARFWTKLETPETAKDMSSRVFEQIDGGLYSIGSSTGNFKLGAYYKVLTADLSEEHEKALKKLLIEMLHKALNEVRGQLDPVIEN